MNTTIFRHSNENIVRISALKFFVASWWLPGDLVSNIINKKAYRKPQEAIEIFRAEILTIVFAILENRCPHKLILSLTDL